MSQNPEYYVLWIVGDVDPELVGPFATRKERDADAIRIRREEGDEDGIYWLNKSSTGQISVGFYTGGFLDEVDLANG